MKVARVVEVLEEFAPPELAAEWDNVGLLVGDFGGEVTRAFLAIDLTEPVLDEALDAGADFLVAYHPPIFRPFSRLTDRDPKQRLVLRAAAAGAAIHSPHTALDAAEGGINDWLAEGVGRGDVRALTPFQTVRPTEATKIVTFCPADAVDRVRNALASVGAGRVGDYEQCSFGTPGTGTFFGGESTSPAVGERGELERVDEIRLEMVCPEASLPLAVTAIEQFHPYEEPPIEIHRLEARPVRTVGEGRRVVLDRPEPLRTVVERIKGRLGVERLFVARPEGAEERPVEIVGLCAGSGGALLQPAIEDGCTLFLTGELRHHDVLDAIARGCAVALAGHTNTERGYLPRLAERLRAALPDLPVVVSEVDRDPLTAM